MPTTYTVRLISGETFGPAEFDTIRSWASQGRIPKDARLIGDDGSEPIIAGEHPQLAGILNAPPTIAGAVTRRETDTDATGGLIPYKNMPALTGYYISIASLIGLLLPLIGLAVSIPAVVLGIKGLRLVKREPNRKGTAHAWVAIILGGLVTLAQFATIGLILFSILYRG